MWALNHSLFRFWKFVAISQEAPKALWGHEKEIWKLFLGCATDPTCHFLVFSIFVILVYIAFPGSVAIPDLWLSRFSILGSLQLKYRIIDFKLHRRLLKKALFYKVLLVFSTSLLFVGLLPSIIRKALRLFVLRSCVQGAPSNSASRNATTQCDNKSDRFAKTEGM